MITPQDIKKLASLARMEIREDELSSFASQIDSILGFVSQITETTGDVVRNVGKLHNVMREDIPTNISGEYTEALLSNAPSREGNYLKVKKILDNSDDII